MIVAAVVNPGGCQAIFGGRNHMRQVKPDSPSGRVVTQDGRSVRKRYVFARRFSGRWLERFQGVSAAGPLLQRSREA